MQDIVLDATYEFVPPYRGALWVRLVRLYLARHLRKRWGIERVECRGVELLRESIAAGYGILLAPNHCRPPDPMVMAVLSKEARHPFFTMASWHLFMQSSPQRWFIRRMGAFSVYREGVDRVAVSYAIGILKEASRPLVIFPEGAISRTNDVLFDLMGGTAFIARSAAKKRAKAVGPEGAGRVVVHPVAMKYLFDGDVGEAIDPVLTDLEQRMTWRPQRELLLLDRLRKVGGALLSLKEIEHVGEPQPGALFERTPKLIDAILEPLEDEWVEGQHDGDVISRVKRLRIAILPEMVAGEVDDDEVARRWRQLEDMRLAQQIGCFPEDYVGDPPIRERVVETVERFDEDVTGTARIHRPMSAIVEVGEPIEVATQKPPKGQADPLLEELEARLKEMIASLGDEAKQRRAAE